MNKKTGIIYVTLAAICWGLIGVFVRALNDVGFQAFQVVAIRAIGTSILLGGFFLFKDRNIFKIKLKDIWVFIGTGIGSMVFFNFCYFASIARTSLAIAAALLYTAPAFVAIFAAIFLKEKVSRKGIIAIVCAIIGCMMTSGLITEYENVDVIGFLLGIGSGIGYALYTIFGKFAIKRGYNSITTTFYTFLFAMLCTSASLVKSPLANQDFITIIARPKFIISLLGLVVISTIVAYIFYTKGLEGVKAEIAAVFASIEPVVAAIISVIIFKEKMSWDIVVGFILIIGSTVIMAYDE